MEDMLQSLRSFKADLFINTVSTGKTAASGGFLLRREAIESGLVCMTSMDTVRTFTDTLESIYFAPFSLHS
jgi:carbamoyl-phosphate synthase large subunit